MENLDKIFEKFVKEEVITEEVKSEIGVVLEAVISEQVEIRVSEAKELLLKEYDEKFEVAVAEENETTKNLLNDYLKKVVVEFKEENKVQIQNTIVVEKAKAIIDGVQKVFEENGIKLPENDTEIVEELNTKNVELLNEYNESVSKSIELEKALEETEKAIVFMKSTVDMSDVSKEKLINLMKGLVVESVEDFGTKLEIIKSNFVAEKKKVTKEGDEDDVEDKVEKDDDEDKKDDEDESVKEAKEKVSKHLSQMKDLRNGRRFF